MKDIFFPLFANYSKLLLQVSEMVTLFEGFFRKDVVYTDL
jgi:hypothetical protein